MLNLFKYIGETEAFAMMHGTWHMTVLSDIYKGNGDLQDPNNHKGICLGETSYKVISIIIAQDCYRN